MTIVLDRPWDMAGVDGHRAARALFGEAVDHLAPFQSLETKLGGMPCGVLRLGDHNFRIAYPGPLGEQVAALQMKVWVRQLPWMSAVAVPMEQFQKIAAQATVRAPHRLRGLPMHRAVPAQVEAISVLIWRRLLNGQSILELNMATSSVERLLGWLDRLD
ncbi:MAG: hypothetical protein ACFCVD_09870 [Nodosilinea sp.]